MKKWSNIVKTLKDVYATKLARQFTEEEARRIQPPK
jgi:hypothetical protein